MSAVIHQINASRGGVPKLPLPSADVGPRGITVDVQRDKRAHGSPDQALCLFALEVIERLQAEGNPISPGSTGENITVSGLDWTTVRPGARIRLGDDVLIEITDYAGPCKTITRSFADTDFNRINHALHPDESRVYAKVIAPGTIRPADRVELIPEETADRVARREIRSFRWPQDF